MAAAAQNYPTSHYDTTILFHRNRPSSPCSTLSSPSATDTSDQEAVVEDGVYERSNPAHHPKNVEMEGRAEVFWSKEGKNGGGKIAAAKRQRMIGAVNANRAPPNSSSAAMATACEWNLALQAGAFEIDPTLSDTSSDDVTPCSQRLSPLTTGEGADSQRAASQRGIPQTIFLDFTKFLLLEREMASTTALCSTSPPTSRSQSLLSESDPPRIRVVPILDCTDESSGRPSTSSLDSQQHSQSQHISNSPLRSSNTDTVVYAASSGKPSTQFTEGQCHLADAVLTPLSSAHRLSSDVVSMGEKGGNSQKTPSEMDFNPRCGTKNEPLACDDDNVNTGSLTTWSVPPSRRKSEVVDSYDNVDQNCWRISDEEIEEEEQYHYRAQNRVLKMQQKLAADQLPTANNESDSIVVAAGSVSIFRRRPEAVSEHDMELSNRGRKSILEAEEELSSNRYRHCAQDRVLRTPQRQVLDQLSKANNGRNASLRQQQQRGTLSALGRKNENYLFDGCGQSRSDDDGRSSRVHSQPSDQIKQSRNNSKKLTRRSEDDEQPLRRQQQSRNQTKQSLNYSKMPVCVDDDQESQRRSVLDRQQQPQQRKMCLNRDWKFQVQKGDCSFQNTIDNDEYASQRQERGRGAQIRLDGKHSKPAHKAGGDNQASRASPNRGRSHRKQGLEQLHQPKISENDPASQQLSQRSTDKKRQQRRGFDDFIQNKSDEDEYASQRQSHKQNAEDTPNSLTHMIGEEKVQKLQPRSNQGQMPEQEEHTNLSGQVLHRSQRQGTRSSKLYLEQSHEIIHNERQQRPHRRRSEVASLRDREPTFSGAVDLDEIESNEGEQISERQKMHFRRKLEKERHHIYSYQNTKYIHSLQQQKGSNQHQHDEKHCVADQNQSKSNANEHSSQRQRLQRHEQCNRKQKHQNKSDDDEQELQVQQRQISLKQRQRQKQSFQVSHQIKNDDDERVSQAFHQQRQKSLSQEETLLHNHFFRNKNYEYKLDSQQKTQQYSTSTHEAMADSPRQRAHTEPEWRKLCLLNVDESEPPHLMQQLRRYGSQPGKNMYRDNESGHELQQNCFAEIPHEFAKSAYQRRDQDKDYTENQQQQMLSKDDQSLQHSRKQSSNTTRTSEEEFVSACFIHTLQNRSSESELDEKNTQQTSQESEKLERRADFKVASILQVHMRQEQGFKNTEELDENDQEGAPEHSVRKCSAIEKTIVITREKKTSMREQQLQRLPAHEVEEEEDEKLVLEAIRRSNDRFHRLKGLVSKGDHPCTSPNRYRSHPPLHYQQRHLETNRVKESVCEEERSQQQRTRKVAEVPTTHTSDVDGRRQPLIPPQLMTQPFKQIPKDETDAVDDYEALIELIKQSEEISSQKSCSIDTAPFSPCDGPKRQQSNDEESRDGFQQRELARQSSDRKDTLSNARSNENGEKNQQKLLPSRDVVHDKNEELPLMRRMEKPVRPVRGETFAIEVGCSAESAPLYLRGQLQQQHLQRNELYEEESQDKKNLLQTNWYRERKAFTEVANTDTSSLKHSGNFQKQVQHPQYSCVAKANIGSVASADALQRGTKKPELRRLSTGSTAEVSQTVLDYDRVERRQSMRDEDCYSSSRQASAVSERGISLSPTKKTRSRKQETEFASDTEWSSDVVSSEIVNDCNSIKSPPILCRHHLANSIVIKKNALSRDKVKADSSGDKKMIVREAGVSTGCNSLPADGKSKISGLWKYDFDGEKEPQAKYEWQSKEWRHINYSEDLLIKLPSNVFGPTEISLEPLVSLKESVERKRCESEYDKSFDSNNKLPSNPMQQPHLVSDTSHVNITDPGFSSASDVERSFNNMSSPMQQSQPVLDTGCGSTIEQSNSSASDAKKPSGYPSLNVAVPSYVRDHAADSVELNRYVTKTREIEPSKLKACEASKRQVFKSDNKTMYPAEMDSPVLSDSRSSPEKIEHLRSDDIMDPPRLPVVHTVQKKSAAELRRARLFRQARQKATEDVDEEDDTLLQQEDQFSEPSRRLLKVDMGRQKLSYIPGHSIRQPERPPGSAVSSFTDDNEVYFQSDTLKFYDSLHLRTTMHVQGSEAYPALGHISKANRVLDTHFVLRNGDDRSDEDSLHSTVDIVQVNATGKPKPLVYDIFNENGLTNTPEDHQSASLTLGKSLDNDVQYVRAVLLDQPDDQRKIRLEIVEPFSSQWRSKAGPDSGAKTNRSRTPLAKRFVAVVDKQVGIVKKGLRTPPTTQPPNSNIYSDEELDDQNRPLVSGGNKTLIGEIATNDTKRTVDKDWMVRSRPLSKAASDVIRKEKDKRKVTPNSKLTVAGVNEKQLSNILESNAAERVNKAASDSASARNASHDVETTVCEVSLIEFSRAIHSRKEVLGDEHVALAASLSKAGNMLCEMGSYSHALLHFEESLAINIKVYGEHHLEVARVLNNVGCTLGALGRLGAAIQSFDTALRIFKSKTNSASFLNKKLLFREATIFCNMGHLYLSQRNFQRAASAYENAVHIQAIVLGPGNELRVKTEEKLELAKRNRNDGAIPDDFKLRGPAMASEFTLFRNDIDPDNNEQPMTSFLSKRSV